MFLDVYGNSDRPLLYRLADACGFDRNLAACCLCEVFCTFFLLYGGCSVGAVNVLTGRNFTYMNPVGWGLVLVFTIYIGFHVS
ncbi:hypothetical protein AAVH_35855, partial [Aphelenchoides avenae]